MNWFRKERPRPLRVATSETYAEHVSTKLKAIIDGQNLLLQSHAALEHRLEQQSDNYRLLVGEAKLTNTRLLELDARLKVTGDAISVHIDRLSQKLFEESIPELYGEFGTINDTVDALAKELALARRSRRKKAKK